MVVSGKVENPFYRGIGRQRVRCLGKLAQVIERTAIPVLRKYIAVAAKHVGAGLLEFAVPEIADVVSGRKKLPDSRKSVGRQFLSKQMGSFSKTKTASRVIPTKSSKHYSRSGKVALQALLNIQVE